MRLSWRRVSTFRAEMPLVAVMTVLTVAVRPYHVPLLCPADEALEQR